MMHRVRIALLAGAIAVSGCVTSNTQSRDDRLASGAILGAIAGGVIGHNIVGGGGSGTGQIIGMLVGAGAGGYGGYMLADHLTRWDKTEMNRTLFQSLDTPGTGQTLTWANDKSGNSGSFTPIRTYMDHAGRLCREYIVTLKVDETPREGKQTACRTATGAWMII